MRAFVQCMHRAYRAYAVPVAIRAGSVPKKKLHSNSSLRISANENGANAYPSPR